MSETNAQEFDLEPLLAANRLLVVGASGSGKSTLARKLAELLGLPYVELDALYHNPGWVESSPEEFRRRVAARTNGRQWVIDGNYLNFLSDITWPEAEVVVWLNYPRHFVIRRLLKRTLGRLITRKELWNGNRESLRSLLQKDNVIAWSWKSHPMLRQAYPRLFFAHPGIICYQLRTAKEAADFVRALQSGHHSSPAIQ